MIRGQDIKYALYYKKAKTNKTNIMKVGFRFRIFIPFYKIS